MDRENFAKLGTAWWICWPNFGGTSKRSRFSECEPSKLHSSLLRDCPKIPAPQTRCWENWKRSFPFCTHAGTQGTWGSSRHRQIQSGIIADFICSSLNQKQSGLHDWSRRRGHGGRTVPWAYRPVVTTIRLVQPHQWRNDGELIGLSWPGLHFERPDTAGWIRNAGQCTRLKSGMFSIDKSCLTQ